MKPLALALALLIALAPACMPAAKPPMADVAQGELAAQPGAVVRPGSPGLHKLGDGALLYVPARIAEDRPTPLLVMLHGAGGNARYGLDMVQAEAERQGFIVLAPESAGATWDIIAQRRYGSDVRALNSALTRIFAAYWIDPARIAIGGFSDGASYALSLGLTNGELFRHVIAFSPGFAAPGRAKGRPHIFISHGTGDEVLPINATSRRVAPRLRAAGYDVDYREFAGGHVVPPDQLQAGLAPLSPASSPGTASAPARP